jgi:hypothetical protein
MTTGCPSAGSGAPDRGTLRHRETRSSDHSGFCPVPSIGVHRTEAAQELDPGVRLRDTTSPASSPETTGETPTEPYPRDSVMVGPSTCRVEAAATKVSELCHGGWVRKRTENVPRAVRSGPTAHGSSAPARRSQLASRKGGEERVAGGTPGSPQRGSVLSHVCNPRDALG